MRSKKEGKTATCSQNEGGDGKKKRPENGKTAGRRHGFRGKRRCKNTYACRTSSSEGEEKKKATQAMRRKTGPEYEKAARAGGGSAEDAKERSIGGGWGEGRVPPTEKGEMAHTPACTTAGLSPGGGEVRLCAQHTG